MEPAGIVLFETDQEVADMLSYMLSARKVNHVVYGFPGQEPPSIQLLLEVISRHRPAIVISSWRHIGKEVARAVSRSIPRPELWVLSGFDMEILTQDGATFCADRVFEKPLENIAVCDEAQRRLAGRDSR